MVGGKQTRIDVFMRTYRQVELWNRRILEAQGYLEDPMLQYKRVKSICEGGQGFVVISKHKNSGILYAVKVVSDKQAALASENPEHTYQEARILESLRTQPCPHKQMLFDVVRTDRRYYIITEYVEGGDMHDMI